MTPEEKAVVQAAITYRDSIRGARSADSRIPMHLITAVDALIFACSECNLGGHTCPGDGNPIAHGDADCGRHDWPCVDCIIDDEDPAPWCDCRCDDDLVCRVNRPCRKRAHAKTECLNAPRCDSPSPEGEWCLFIEDHDGPHQWEDAWVPATWGDVRNGDRVRLGTAQATVRTVGWNVDPKSSEYRPLPIGPNDVGIQLAGRDVMAFPRVGPVDILMGAQRRAEYVIGQRFNGTERVISE